jgi:hypothetical protein
VNAALATSTGYVMHSPPLDEPWQDGFVPADYRKPRGLCRWSPNLEVTRDPRDLARFVAACRAKIERDLARQGLAVRTATLADLPAIRRFQIERFQPIASRILNAYELYRILWFGTALVLVDAAGELMGYDLITYDLGPDQEKTQGSAGIAVHASLAGRRIASMMAWYSALRAMTAEARVRRGIVHPTNYGSLTTFLNHTGGICDGFQREFADWGPRFLHREALTPGGLANNRLDPARVVPCLAQLREGSDYQLVDGADLDLIEYLYQATDLRVMAVLKAGMVARETRLLALSCSLLTRPAPRMRLLPDLRKASS